MSGPEREALRQQMLLRALWGDARPGVVAGWLRDGARVPAGLAAYRGHAGAVAERALAAAYPTVQALISATSFAALARVLWHRHPPTAGDLGLWGESLPAFIADDEALASEPYLADVARLEWAVHRAASAADAQPPQGLALLADADPADVLLALSPGTALLTSAYPVVTIWQAHRSDEAARFEPVRAAFAAGAGETALVWRQGWQPQVRALDHDEARYTTAVLQGRSLAEALDAVGAGFDFERWLIQALRQGLLTAATLRG